MIYFILFLGHTLETIQGPVCPLNWNTVFILYYLSFLSVHLTCLFVNYLLNDIGTAQYQISHIFSSFSSGLIVRFTRCCIKEWARVDKRLSLYFSALALLHVSLRISRNGISDELLDTLAIILRQYFIFHSNQGCSPFSVSTTAVKLMHLLANKSLIRVPSAVSETKTDTAELVGLLQNFAAEQLIACNRLFAPDFGSVPLLPIAHFEVLYEYKRGDYQQCLQLTLSLSERDLYMQKSLHDKPIHADMLAGPNIPITPEFLQLLDDDIVSLTTMILLVSPKCRHFQGSSHNCISPLTLTLYLMTQCQLKLRHAVTSLAQTLKYIELAQGSNLLAPFVLNNLTLKLLERKVITYIAASK